MQLFVVIAMTEKATKNLEKIRRKQQQKMLQTQQHFIKSVAEQIVSKVKKDVQQIVAEK